MPEVVGHSPMGPQMTGNAPAPTAKDVASDPGAFAGTAHDPVRLVVPRRAISRFATVRDEAGEPVFSGSIFAQWMRHDPVAALEWFKDVYRFDLNVEKLAPSQVSALGLVVTK